MRSVLRFRSSLVSLELDASSQQTHFSSHLQCILCRPIIIGLDSCVVLELQSRRKCNSGTFSCSISYYILHSDLL